MDGKAARREAVKAYKERKEVGGLYRIVSTKSGWQGPLMGTPNLEGARNRFEFGKKTGACFDSSAAAQWAQDGPEAFEFVEVERLEKKPEQSSGEFREEIAAMLEMWGGEGK